jgi:integrase
MRGSVSKRCPCPVTYSATGRRRACKKDHGSWYYVVDLGRGSDGKRRQERRGGYHTRDEAEEAMAAVIKTIGEGTHAHDGRLTVGEFLDHWLTDKVAAGLRPTTERSYRQHIRDHLTPQLGNLRLRDLRPNHVAALLRTVAQGQPGKPAPGPASVRRVHATLRSALTSAHRQQLVAFNAAANLDLPTAARPKVRPWEPAELGRFLDSIGGNRLAPLFELIAATGLRRGEACGLRWSDVDLGRGVVVVRQQLVQVTVDEHMPKCTCCGEVHKGLMIGPPKTKAGESRAVELDGGTIGVLLAHRLAQDAERLEWGRAYTDHGLVFARENGSPLPLDHVTKRFHELAVAAGLRPIRLHGLRHGAASLMLAAGVDLALVSKRLGHSSISITSDTYSHLLEGVGREAAERAAALVPRNRGDQPVTNPSKSVGKSLTEEGEYPQVKGGAPRGNRTPNPLIKRKITPNAVLTCVFARRVRAQVTESAGVKTITFDLAGRSASVTRASPSRQSAFGSRRAV